MPRSMAPSIGLGSRRYWRGGPTKVAAIALANKLARTAWAMMTRGERYKEPVPAFMSQAAKPTIC